MIPFSNSHFLFGSLSSYYATNLKLCQSRTSAVRQTPPPSQVPERNVQDVCCPQGCVVCWHCVQLPGPATQGTSVLVFSKSALGETKEPKDPKGLPG